MIGDEAAVAAVQGAHEQLPASYRTAVDAMERYLMCFGPGDGDSAASMFEDLADLFEQGAADGTPIREIVGEDPVEFVEAFLAQLPEGRVDQPGAGTADQRHRARRRRRHRRRRETSR